MIIKKLTDELSVTAQIEVTDLAEIARLGFKSLIANRPDGESPDQPAFSQIGAAAKMAELEARYIPVVVGQVSDRDVSAFKAAFAELPKPVLAYCRSGTRSAALWDLSKAV